MRATLLTKVTPLLRAALVVLAFFAPAVLGQQPLRTFGQSAQPVAGPNLLQVYEASKAYDAQYAAARYALQAGLEKLPQGRALLLPTIDLNPAGTGATSTRSDILLRNTPPGGSTSLLRDVHSYGYQLRLSQPIFRMPNLLQYDQAEYQVKQAEAVFGQASQDLILRVAQAYFDLLAAQDNLTLVKSQKASIAEQLAQAKRNFEVGTATITDTYEAQARFDLVGAQEIVADNAVETKQRELQEIAGKLFLTVKPLRPGVKHEPPNPARMQDWVELAENQGFPVLAQDAVAEVAGLEARRAAAAHLPTLDLVGSYGMNSSTGSTAIASFGSTKTTTGVLGLQLGLPIYSGGSLNSKEREAAALSEKAKQELKNVRRNQALAARQNYLLVVNGISTTAALEQALISSRSSYEANKLGFEVGVRISIDVLNAEQQVYNTSRDLLVARYGTIMNHLKLKAAAGSLREEDLEIINRALEP
jgi:outer membrane protein